MQGQMWQAQDLHEATRAADAGAPQLPLLLPDETAPELVEFCMRKILKHFLVKKKISNRDNNFTPFHCNLMLDFVKYVQGN